MKNKILILIFSIIIISCNGAKTTNLNEGSKVKISLMIDGTFDDKSFNESAWHGAERIEKEFNFKITPKEGNPSSYLADLESLKDNGSNFIWMIGYKLTNVSLTVPLENPDVKYAIIDPVYDKGVTLPQNLAGMTFKSEEGAFLSGYLAAKTTKTGKVGFIGGVKGEIVDAFRYGYEAGAKYANKDIDITSQYVGNFLDVELGRTFAEKMYRDGIDIIHHAAGLGGIGAIEAAKELGPEYLIIGVDQDQSYLAPNNILTSSTKDIGKAVYLFTSKYLKTNTFEGGKLTNYGLKEGVVGIVKNSKMIPVPLMDKINEIEKKIISYEIVVPSNEVEYNDFIKNLS